MCSEHCETPQYMQPAHKPLGRFSRDLFRVDGTPPSSGLSLIPEPPVLAALAALAAPWWQLWGYLIRLGLRGCASITVEVIEGSQC
jgi:hypothetical protein